MIDVAHHVDDFAGDSFFSTGAEIFFSVLRGIVRETMVLRGDRDFAAVQIFDRLVGAAMTEFQFECRSPKREAENLMAETNSKDRLLPHQIGDGLVRIR